MHSDYYYYFFIISKVIINVNFNYLVTFVINNDFEIKKTLKMFITY